MDPGTTRIGRGAFTEVFSTVRLDPSQPVTEAARESQESFLRLIRDEGVTVLHERLYGPAGARETVLSTRRDAYRDAGAPAPPACSYVYGRKDDDFGGLTGGLLWGVIPTGGATTVDTLPAPGGTAAHLLRSAGLELLYAPSISGSNGSDPAAQASSMFRDAARLLETHGFAYRDVVRTWIYLPRILEWYDEFNSVRTDFHRAHGVVGTDEAPFPASTGVQGGADQGECTMDLVAVRAGEGANLSLRPLGASSRQNRAMAYGSGFSRGMAMELGGRTTVWVSGTASIDAQGRSRHIGARDAQIVETLLNVAALVEPEGAGLRDICAGTLYCKDTQTYRAYLEVVRLLDLEELPLIPVLADICRDELLVEIEAVVAVPEQRSR